MGIDRLIIPIELDTNNLEESAERARAALRALGASQREIDAVGKKVASTVNSEAQAFQRLLERLDPAIRRTNVYRRAVEALDREKNRGNLSAAEHSRLVGLAATRYGQARAGVLGLVHSLGTLRGALAGAGFLVGVAQVSRFARSLVDAELKLQAIQRRMAVAFGAGTGADAGLQFTRDVAGSYGLDLEQTAQGFSRLAVAARGTALEGARAREVFLGFAKASAAMQLSGSELEGVLRAVEQMISKGTVQAEELRGQLGERLPGAFQTAANSLGVTTQELDKMLRDGKVLAWDLLPKMAAELEKTSGKAARENVASLQGSINALNTSWFDLKTTMADGDAFASAINFIRRLTDAVRAWFELHERIIRLMKSVQGGPWGTGSSAPARNFTDLPVYGPTPSGGNLDQRAFTAAASRFGGTVAGLVAASDPLQAALKRSGDAYREGEKDAKAYREEIKRLVERVKSMRLSHVLPEDVQRLTDAQYWSRLQTQAKALFSGPLVTGRPGPSPGEEFVEEMIRAVTRTPLKDIFRISDFAYEVTGVFWNAAQGAVDGFRYSLTDLFYTFDFSKFADNMADVLRYTLAQLFSDLAVAFGRELAKEAAAASGTAYVGKYGSLSGLGATGLIVGGIAALGYAFNKKAKSRNNNRYTSSAGVSLTSTGGMRGGYGAVQGTSNADVQGEIEAAIIGLLASFQAATGAFITGMANVSVLIRHDKGAYKVGEMVFATWEAAVVEAARQAFLSSELSREIAPEIRRYIEGFTLGDPDKLIQGVELIGQILDEFSGLSDVEIALRNLPQQIAAVRQQLLDFGVSAGDAFALSAKYGVNQLLGIRRSITGEQMTPEQELELRKKQAALFNAQVALMRAELEARKAYLEGQLKLAQAEWGGGGGVGQRGGGGFRSDMMRAQISFVKAEAEIFNAELQVQRSYLTERQNAVNAQAAILQAELDAINQVLGALRGIEIDIGSISIGGIGGFVRESQDYWRTIVGSLSALSPQRQLEAAREHFERELAKGDAGDVEGARSLYLETAKNYYGSTAAYAQIFADVMARSAHIGSLSDQETQARLRAIGSLGAFSGAVMRAATTIGGWGGFQIPTAPIAPLPPAPGVNPPTQPVGPGWGGGGGFENLLHANAQNAQDIVHAINTSTRQTTAVLSGGVVSAPIPVPPPPPSGGTIVFGGGFRSAARVM